MVEVMVDVDVEVEQTEDTAGVTVAQPVVKAPTFETVYVEQAEVTG